MTFCIITNVVHTKKDGIYYAYAPYVNEMNLWIKYANQLILVAPKDSLSLSPIFTCYNHKNIKFIEIDQFDILSIKSKIKALLSVGKNLRFIYKAMQQADHIHLRCPANIGLLACFVQILFPHKPKTAKYAGNWDSKPKQPLSYRLQKLILSNTFLTRNMQVLVYGEWENQTKNIKPFFTATYRESDKKEVTPRILEGAIKFLFVGSLVKGKHPLYAVQIIEKLCQLGFKIRLDIYGEGAERNVLKSYIKDKKLESIICLYGNQTQLIIKEAYINSHFLILPSESEGWPKVVAEAMFWGCLPIATKVSCVPNMLDFGIRGILLSEILENDVKIIISLLNDQELYNIKIKEAVNWSQNYTMDKFESQINLLLKE